MPRISASVRQGVKRMRKPAWTYYDFALGGVSTIGAVSLTPATGQVATRQANGVRMQWTAATSGQQVGILFTPSVAIDFNSVDTFAFDFDFSADLTAAALGGLRVIMSSDTSGYTNYFSVLANTGKEKLGRRLMWLNKADFTPSGAAAWNNIKRVEVYWQRSTRNTTVVPLDILFKGFFAGAKQQVATAIWTFDDGDASQFTEAWSGATNPGHSLSAYGWPGSFFVNSNSIGTGGKMTLANLATLRDAGCGIYSHTHSHLANAWQFSSSITGTTVTLTNAASVGHGRQVGNSITVRKMDPIEMNGTFSVATAADAFTLTYTCPTPEATSNLLGYNALDVASASALSTDIQTCIDYLVNNGFPNAGKHYAYPYGYHSDAAIAILQSKGIKSARTLATMTGSKQAYGWLGNGIVPSALDWYRVPARSFSNGDTTSSILADISAVIKYGGTIPLLVHNLTGAPAVSRDYSLSNFVTIIDTLRYWEKQGLIQFLEWDDYYNQCLADA